MITSESVRQAMQGHVAELVHQLLPDGQERGGELWALNPSRSDTHLGSFSVALDGERAGQWHDFASGDGGDLFDLVRLVTGCDFKGAVAWCAHVLGMQATDPRLEIRRPAPGVVAEWKRREASGEFDHQGCTIEQLATAKRIPADVLRSFGLEDQPASGAYPARVLIPYLDRAGDVVARRFRADARPGRGFMWERGSTLGLYGIDRLAGDESRVLLVEGESDCWCLWHAGIAALGIPGAGCWRDEWAADLPVNARVVVVREPDTAGGKLVEKLRRSPLRDRLQVVTLPTKDAADLWVRDPDVERYRAAIEAAMVPKLTVRTHADRLRERLTPGPMILADLCPEGGIAALVAMPGVGKTLAALAVAECIASGSPFAGHAVARGSVLYVCSDSPASTEGRLLAMNEEASRLVFTVTELPSLPDGMDVLRKATKDAETASGVPVRLVVLDTWDSSREHTSGGYADQDGGAEAIMRSLRTFAAEHRCAVLILHHATRADGGRARGSVVFDARCDWIAVVEKGGAGLVVRTTKARDGECGPVGTWSIEPVQIGPRLVPVLREAAVGRAELVALDRERKLLEAAQAMIEGGKQPTARTLAKALGLNGNGAVGRLVETLRTKGLMASDSYAPTQAGVDVLEGVGQSLGRSFSAGQRSGTGADSSVKTKRPSGTDTWDGPNSVPASHTYSVGLGRDTEDAFENAPLVGGRQC